VARYVSEWNAGPNAEWRRRVTVRQLLTHSSGLPAHKDYFLTIHSEREAIADICNESLEYEPGTKTVYRIWVSYLLGEILERVTGRTVDQLARERIFGPLGMATHSSIRRRRSSAASLPRRTMRHFASACFGRGSRRKRVRHGRRSRTRWMFATGPDLAAFCQMLLNGGSYAHQRLLTRATLTQFIASQALRGQHTHPWMDGSNGGSTSGRYFPRAASAISALLARRSGLTRTGNFSLSF